MAPSRTSTRAVSAPTLHAHLAGRLAAHAREAVRGEDAQLDARLGPLGRGRRHPGQQDAARDLEHDAIGVLVEHEARVGAHLDGAAVHELDRAEPSGPVSSASPRTRGPSEAGAAWPPRSSRTAPWIASSRASQLSPPSGVAWAGAPGARARWETEVWEPSLRHTPTPAAGARRQCFGARSPVPREEIDVEDGLLTIAHGDGLDLRQVALGGDGDAVGAGLELQARRSPGRPCACAPSRSG